MNEYEYTELESGLIKVSYKDKHIFTLIPDGEGMYLNSQYSELIPHSLWWHTTQFTVEGYFLSRNAPAIFPRPLCKRTLCTVDPGIPVPGMTCHYAWSGSIPCTGILRCTRCNDRLN
jgi:hypothetical protein